MMSSLILLTSLAVIHCSGAVAYTFDVGSSLALFKEWDANGSGFLTRAEFVNKIKEISKRNAGTNEYYAVFKLFDVSGDKRLDTREFTVGHTLYAEFASYDVNDDYLLDENELFNIFDAPNLEPNQNEIVFVEFLARIINDLKLVYKKK